MALGSVEYIIIEFPDSHFRAEIVPELAKLIESETVRIIDLVFVLKDSDGKVSTFEFDQLEELAAFGTLAGEVGGFVNSEDIDYAADSARAGVFRRAHRMGRHVGERALRSRAEVERSDAGRSAYPGAVNRCRPG